MDVLYAINAKKEPAASLPKFTDESAPLTGSTISIADLLTYVNRYFPDVLPEGMLRHFGHRERPAGKLGEGALFSLKAYSEAEKKDHVKSAKEFFGKTYSWNETGYITTDGTKLDFSGRHDGAPGGQTGRRGDGRDRRGAVWAAISIHAPREGGDSKDAQFYLRIFDKQVELLRFLGKIRGGCLRNPEKDQRFLGKSLANLPEISGHLDFAGGGKARPGYPCAVPLLRRAACVRGSGDPPADRCSSYRNAPLFSHIASIDSKSADCLSQNP